MTGRPRPGVPAPRDGVDMLAVQRDADVLDALARRLEPEPGDEEVRWLLAALAADVDDGLAGLLAEEAASDEATVLELPRERRAAKRALAGALVAAGLLSVSGVAAAVTGDPLAAYRGVYAAVLHGGDAPSSDASEIAALHHRLAGARAAIAQGDLVAAQGAITDVRSRLADLPEQERRSVEVQLRALEAALLRADVGTSDQAREANQRAGAAGAGQATQAPVGSGAPSGVPAETRRAAHPKHSGGAPPKGLSSKPTPTTGTRAGSPTPVATGSTGAGGPTASPTPTPTAGSAVDGNGRSSSTKSVSGQG